MNNMVAPSPVEIVIVEIALQRFGIRAADVREVLHAVTLSAVPGAQTVVRGIVNLRGRVVPVLDIRVLLNLPEKALEPADHLIVAQVGEQLLAICVDRAVDLVRLTPDNIAPAEGIVRNWGIVNDVAKIPDGAVLLLEPSKMLAQAELAALGHSLRAHATIETYS